MVARQRSLELFQYRIAMLLGIHVDEIANDNAAQIAQAQLPRNGLRGFQVGFENGVVKIAQPDKAAGVHVDSGQRFGLVDDEIAARLEIDALGQCPLDFFFHAIQVEQRAFTGVMLQAFCCERVVGLRELQHALIGDTRIHQNPGRVVADKIAQYPQTDIELLIQQLRRTGGLCRVLHVLPELVQIGNIRRKIQTVRRLGNGADDVAALMVRRQCGLQPGAQRLALFCALDALRHANMRFLRQIDQQPPGDADLRGKPRALAADRLLDHLHQQRLPVKKNFFDRLGGIGVIAVSPDIGNMQECRALQADVNEGRLHPGQHPLDPAKIDIADDAAAAAALDIQVLHHAELHHRNPGFLRGDIDQNFFTHIVIVPIGP